jgi:hypothetical protein
MFGAKKVDAKNWSMQQRRALFDNTQGRIFNVTFIKKNGEVRDMQCKKFVERHLTHGLHDVRANPCTHKDNLFTVSDIGAADAFRNINLDKLVKAKVSGVEYVF